MSSRKCATRKRSEDSMMWQQPGISRRSFLADIGMGFTGLALGAMLQRDGIARANAPQRWAPPDGRPHHTPKAKSVIWLFMVGGTSHMESFDPKPELNRFAGRTIAETPYRDALTNPLTGNVRIVVPDDANGHIRQQVYPLQVGYRQRGQSGIAISDWWPNVGECIDDIAVI